MTIIKKHLFAAILLSAMAFLFVSILRDPVECARCVGETLSTLYKNVLPFLFPFMVISGILTALDLMRPLELTVGRIFPVIYRLPRCVSGAFVLGSLCSFPVGAVAVTDLYGKNELTKKEAEVAAALASVTGPSFPVAAVGSLMLGNIRTGWLIYAVQIVIPLILGIPFCRLYIKRKRIPHVFNVKQRPENPLNVFVETVASSSVRCVCVCGTVVFFSLFCDRLISAAGVAGIGKALIYSLFEFSEGCRHSVVSNGSAAAICAFAVSFGGLSVAAQSAGIMAKEGLSSSKLITFKFICGLISGMTVYMLTNHFETFGQKATALPVSFSGVGSNTIPLITLAAMFSGLAARIRHLIFKSY
ncbi:MAG: hypothetical protein IJK58_05030 [Clostridia bacterium]|nr:hypothetical protein [Clostridia bacterium]